MVSLVLVTPKGFLFHELGHCPLNVYKLLALATSCGKKFHRSTMCPLKKITIVSLLLSHYYHLMLPPPLQKRPGTIIPRDFVDILSAEMPYLHSGPKQVSLALLGTDQLA